MPNPPIPFTATSVPAAGPGAPLLPPLLRPLAGVRRDERVTLLLMFTYAFLAMASYNVIKPLATARFITDFGADNLPYLFIAAGVAIGVAMQVYRRTAGQIPRSLVIPATQGGIVLLLIVLWLLLRMEQEWASAFLSLLRLGAGALLIGQLWTLANGVYEPSQARRLFGFIGAGAVLGGLAASLLVVRTVESAGVNDLLLAGAGLLAICPAVVMLIVRRTGERALEGLAAAGHGWDGGFQSRPLPGSKPLQLVWIVIAFAAVGALLIELQLNLAAEAARGREATSQIAALLGLVQAGTSGLGLLLQIWLMGRIHRYLGIGFALLVLPFSLGATAILILLSPAVWAPGLARVLDTSYRYTADRATREILFLPLADVLGDAARPVAGVTIDRLARGAGALLVLVLIKPWGLDLAWPQISYASLAIALVSMFAALAARRGYLQAFHRTLDRRALPATRRIAGVELSMLDTLLEELGGRDEERVLHAIDVLEALDRRDLIPSLLLQHEAPRVRARALLAIAAAAPDEAARQAEHVEALVTDADAVVRTAALEALANVRRTAVLDLARGAAGDPDPRRASAAALLLVREGEAADAERAAGVLERLAADTSDAGASARRDVAAALGAMRAGRLHELLVPLLHDPDPAVARQAMDSIRQLGPAGFRFVPTLVTLLGNRRLKSAARETLVGYGEDGLESLVPFLNDPQEAPGIRRQIPALLARIPSQRSMNLLLAALAAAPGEPLRFALLSAVEKLQREHPELVLDPAPVEQLAMAECQRYFTWLSRHWHLFEQAALPGQSLLAQVLAERTRRSADRISLMLGLAYPWRDVAAARDDLFPPQFREWILPVLDDLPLDEKVRRGNALIGMPPLTVEETLTALVNDEDPVVAAAAVGFVGDLELRTLEPVLEQLLDRRPVTDWPVLEAAWAVLSQRRRRAEGLRALSLEPVPAAAVADRLRRMPELVRVPVDELFRIAAAGRQVRDEPGRVLYRRGQRPATQDFLLEGRLELTGADGHVRTVEPPAAPGLEEALRGVAARDTARSPVISVCLSVRFEDFRTLLSDSPDLAHGLFGTLLDHPAFAGVRLITGSIEGRDAGRASRDGTDRALLLGRLEPFRQVPLEALAHLAAIAQEVVLPDGTLLLADAEPPACYVILEGEVSLAGAGGEAMTAGPGAAVGLYDTLAGSPLGCRASVTRAGRALRLAREDLADCLGQRPVLLEHVFSAFYDTRHAL